MEGRHAPTGGTTTTTAKPHSHRDPGTPGVTCQERSRTQPHEYGGGGHRRPAGKGQPADTTATMTLSMPSWSAAWVTPTRSQHRRRHASTRSHDATMRRTNPSRYHARHISSAITPPWGAPGRLPLRVKGMRPRADKRSGPRTSAAPQEVARAWKRPPTSLASLPARR